MPPTDAQLSALRGQLDEWARALGFSRLAVSAPDLAGASGRLRDWLAQGRHGGMEWLARSVDLREQPDRLVPGTVRVISVALPYSPDNGRSAASVLDDPRLGYVSRYALGRDYHKVMRQRLARLARRLAEAAGGTAGRVFCDSAPVLEVELGVQSGLGWRGKHTLLLHREGGSWFFLGELFTDLPLPVDRVVSEHCGRCTACLEACPTRAIVAPYVVDARRCVSYLTIEHEGPIPEPLRALMGNRIYGCDDCQLHCPWNREGPHGVVAADFGARAGLDGAALCELFAWTAAEFAQRLEGSPIRRIGHRRWLRNIAVALGNGPADARAISALQQRAEDPDPVVREHVGWALDRLRAAGQPAVALSR